MKITRCSYSSASNLTEVVVETITALSPTVMEQSKTYLISLPGYVAAGSDEMYEQCLDELEKAGINLMPF